MIVSPSMSLIAAGVASGICFLIWNNILKGKSEEERKNAIPEDRNRCACCLKPFFVGRGVRCSDCGGRSCRKGCSRWDTTDNAWHCLFCHQQRYWLKRNGKLFENFSGPIELKDLHRFFNTAKSRVYVAGVENAAASSDLALAGEKENANAMETVRDFIEKIVEGLIGNVDDAPIDHLYDHPAYDKLLEKYIVPLADALTRMAVALRLSIANEPNADPPTMAHTALRDIVERAVEEARKLPGLGASGDTGRPQQGRNITENSYEDLLATAILNKVIEKFQKEQVDGNSNVLHDKPVSSAKCALREIEMGLDEGVEEGSSSLEPLSQDDYSSDCSASCSRHVRNQPEPLSLTIEERIEEVTTTYASDEDPRDNDVLAIRNTHRVPFPELGMDIIDPFQESEDSQDEPDTPTTHIGLVSPIESWEENWLFQKKRVQTQADPVAMLVPNPSADFKALIGDKDAEDTSDLSECSSAQSDEEIEKELMVAINNVVPRSPKKEPENGLDHPLGNSNEVSTGKTHEKTLSNSHMIENSIHDQISNELDKTDSRIREKSTTEKENGNEDLEMSIAEIQRDTKENAETKEEEKSSKCDVRGNTAENSHAPEKIEKEPEESVSESMNAVNDETQKVETEKTNEQSKENVIENAVNGDDSRKVSQSMEQIQFVDNSANSSNLASPTEENVSLLPKTPASTPTMTSMAEVNLGNVNNEDIFPSREENVLSSLECAKQKLMAVDDDAMEAFKMDEEQRADFHAEDIQQESEYTEHYDIATQRHLDSLTKTDISLTENGTADNESELESGTVNDFLSENTESKCREAVATAKAESAFLRNRKSEEEVQLATPPRPGTIAEREHKKWENAPPIENNPYSKKNIQRRLWERQYSRRSSDIPGIHTELPKSNEADLDVVLSRHEPNIKRFGRDYYINESRSSSNEKGRRSAASSSSRPGSSLSQRSNSTGTDQEQQEEIQYKETESLLNRSNDVKSKVAKRQNNHAETKYQPARDSSTDSIQSYTAEKTEEKYPKNTDSQKTWEDQRMEEILENERKNSKNEINAKLNNQENYDNPVIETKKSNSEENQRKIKRIDLKAYGFENEFFSNANKTMKTSTPRVVNKLDLKSFGYDGGIRRTQSNIHLNRIAKDHDFKPRIIRVTNKSNLERHDDYENGHHATENDASEDNNLTQSTEALNKFDSESYNGFGLKSAKSVPNIAKFYSNMSSNQEDEEVECYNGNSPYNDIGISTNGSVRNVANHYNPIRSDSSIGDESEIDTDNSSERDQSMTNGKKKSLSNDDFDDKVLPMPSVRRLAQAFNKQPEAAPTPASKVTKPSNACKERSSTPEIQIVETPRQMHSLTARSLSKQFREGLRQIPTKVASPPASHVAMEQSKLSENQTEVVQSTNDIVANDTNVILPGKLKSNIIFWEQMQKKC